MANFWNFIPRYSDNNLLNRMLKAHTLHTVIINSWMNNLYVWIENTLYIYMWNHEYIIHNFRCTHVSRKINLYTFDPSSTDVRRPSSTRSAVHCTGSETWFECCSSVRTWVRTTWRTCRTRCPCRWWSVRRSRPGYVARRTGSSPAWLTL